MLCYVVFVDWHALAQRLGLARGGTAAVRTAPGTAAAALVGGLLLAANSVYGALGIDSWPVSSYPRFERIRREPVKVRMEAMLESESGSRPVKLPLRLSSVGRILRLSDPDEREKHLNALVGTLLARDGPLQPGESLRIYSSTYSTLPEDRRSPPLRREVVFAYPAGDHVGPRAQP